MQLAIMLLGENFRRRHHRRLKFIFDRLCAGQRGNNSFAAADIALQQALHRVPCRQIAADFIEGPALRTR